MTLEVCINNKNKYKPMTVILRKRWDESWVSLGWLKDWDEDDELTFLVNKVKHKKLTIRNVNKYLYKTNGVDTYMLNPNIKWLSKEYQITYKIEGKL